MHDIAVIVVNWNAREDLRACLDSLTREPQPQCDFAVWVVDNCSSDGSADMVAGSFPGAHLIRNRVNSGFAHANNQAVAEAVAQGYRYFFLLNSDAAIESPEMLDKIVAFGDANSRVGIFGTKVLNPDGSIQFSCRRFPTLAAGVFRNTVVGRFFPKNKYAASYLMADVDHSKPRQVGWVSGCSMVIRASLVKRIGMLDERFFMYCEDVDLCRRATDVGDEVWYSPDAVVVHKIGASSDKNAEKMIWEFHRSWDLYVRKHYPGNHRLRFALVKAGLWLRATVRIFNRRRAARLRERAGQASFDRAQERTKPASKQ